MSPVPAAPLPNGRPLSDVLPPVSPAALPPDVRRGSAEDRRLYGAALGFERMLVGELVRTMSEAAKAGGEADGEGGGASSFYREMMTGSLADSVVANGGMGLAEDIYRVLRAGGR